MKKKDLEPARFEMPTSDVLHQTLTNLVEGFTGLASSSKQGLALYHLAKSFIILFNIITEFQS